MNPELGTGLRRSLPAPSKPRWVGSSIFAALSAAIVTAALFIAVADPGFGFLLLAGGVFLFTAGEALLGRGLLLLAAMVVVSAFAGAPRASGSVEIGGLLVTPMGITWLWLAGLLVLFLMTRLRRSLELGTYWILALPLPWVAFRWVFTGLDPIGARDMLFFSLPVLMGAAAGVIASGNSRGAARTLERLILCSLVIPVFVIFFSLWSGWVEMDRVGLVGAFSPRPIAMYSMVVASLALAVWRYDQSATIRASGLMASGVALAIAVGTLSRMAAATIVVLIGISRVNPRRKITIVASLGAGVGLAVLLLLAAPGFRERMFLDGGQGQSVFESVDTSGRLDMWDAAFSSAMQRPLIGHGPGRVREVVAQIMREDRGEEYHPHNEFLAMFHDFGVIGLVLLIVGWGYWLIKSWILWKEGARWRNADLGKWSMATFLCLIGIFLTALTGNTFHYAFITGPGAMLIGVMIATARREALRNGESTTTLRPAENRQDRDGRP
jgi:O-antigen ligase